MTTGYNGKILHVDLTNKKMKIEQPEEAFYRKHLGGQAMGVYYLLKNLKPKTDALAPENILAITLGAVTGVRISGQSRVVVTAKSPLTGTIGTSEAGGFWPAVAKFAGFDGFIITGKSSHPVYLYVHDGEAELRDANHLWGKTTGETEEILKSELGNERFEVLQIGPAGEKLVRFAAVMNMRCRANGRTGMGAVMGSKNLKAVVVRGSHKPTIADPVALKELSSWGSKNLKTSDAYGTGVLGTAGIVDSLQAMGGLPAYNWDSGVFDEHEAISGQTMADTILKKRDTCFSCILRCKRVVEIKEGPFQVDPQYGGPEYETIGEFGSLCGIGNLAAISKANQICNMYGLDTIQTGGTVAWMMDCFSKGIITKQDCNGLDLSYGNAEAMVKLTEMIAKREGIGDLLAEGVDQAADKFGPQARALTMTVKGNVLPSHMPQPKRSLALIYATNPHGADHMSSEHDPSYGGYPIRMKMLGLTNPPPLQSLNEEKVRYTYLMECYFSFLNSLAVCHFIWGPGWQLYGPDQTIDFVRAVTGWDFSIEEAMEIGERSLNMMRAFNVREGFSRKEDTLPMKLYTPLHGGATDGVGVTKEEVDAAITTYYSLAGWDNEGRPTKQRLEKLDLAWLSD